MTLRRRTYRLLERPEQAHFWGQFVEFLLIALIIANIVAISLETVPSLDAVYGNSFRLFENISIGIFTVEYIARLWVAPEGDKDRSPTRARLAHARTPMALVDLLAILPAYLHIFFVPLDLRMLRVLRLLRIFKLTRYSTALSMLLDVLREESRSFLAAISILAVLMVLAASGAWLAEHRAQPEAFGSIPAAMWWAMATLTTVGYGDVTPITVLGKVFGGVVTLIGVGMAALPAGILATGLADHLHRRREDLKTQFRIALEDGHIDIHEARELEDLRIRLGISANMAHKILHKVQVAQLSKAQAQKKPCTCPHCGTTFTPDD